MLYCSGSMCVGVTVWFGWGGVVSLCRLQRYGLLHPQKFVRPAVSMLHVLATSFLGHVPRGGECVTLEGLT